MSTLLNASKKVAVFRKGTHQWIRSIVPSDPTALTRQVNGITLHENCDQKYTGLVTV
jgi:hypothetical protein